jgi:DNA-binding CsgD family transcriptional regulator
MQDLLQSNLLGEFDPMHLTMRCGTLLSPMEILVAVLRQFGFRSPIDLALKLKISEDAASEYERRIRRKLGLEKGANFDPIFRQIIAELKNMRE